MKLKYILFFCFIFNICFSASQEQDVENFNFNFKTIDTFGIIFNPASLGYLYEHKISIGGFAGDRSYGTSMYFLGHNFNLANSEQKFNENNISKKKSFFKTSLGFETFPNLFTGVSWKFVKIDSQKQENIFAPSLDLGLIYSILDKKGNSYDLKFLYQNFAYPNLFWQIKSSIKEKKKFDLGINFNHKELFSMGILVELGEESFAKKIYHEIHLGGVHWYQDKKLGLVGEGVVRINESAKNTKWLSVGLSYKPEIEIEETEKIKQIFLSKLIIDLGIKIILSEKILERICFLNIGKEF